MVDARVDLPEPLGPMMAWVWPVLMVRLTPFRISLVPCSVSMLTCSSLISRVDLCLVLLCTVAGAAVRFLVDKFWVLLAAAGRGWWYWPRPGQLKFGASAPFRTVLTST